VTAFAGGPLIPKGAVGIIGRVTRSGGFILELVSLGFDDVGSGIIGVHRAVSCCGVIV
jgi:hypothetical protein